MKAGRGVCTQVHSILRRRAVPQGRTTQNRFLYSVFFLDTLYARIGKYLTDFVFCHFYPDRKHNCLEPAVFRTYLVVFRRGVARLTTTYSIDCSARVVFTSIRAPLTLGDLIALGDALRNDPSFDPRFDELLEVSPGSAVDLRYADVRAATTTDPFSKQSRRAIVVHADVDFGVARMYELMHGGHIHVFRSLETAREFLGLNRK